MSMQPQVTQATGKSSFTILETFTDRWGRNRALVKGMYGTSEMDVHTPHKDCEYKGTLVVSHDEWADNYYCSGCNYSAYYPLGN